MYNDIEIYPEWNFVRGRKTWHRIFLPLPVYGTGVILWCVCASVFWKIMNNFWMDGPIRTKFSVLSRLVMANLGVDSTNAQSPPQLGLGLHTVLFPGVYLLWGHGCYLVVSFHLRMHLMRQTIMWERIFDFGPLPILIGYAGTDYKGGHNFLQIGNQLTKGQCWCVRVGGCMCVRMYFLLTQPDGRILMKFGTEVVIDGRKVLLGIQPATSHPPGMVCVNGSKLPLEPQPPPKFPKLFMICNFFSTSGSPWPPKRPFTRIVVVGANG